ncbi:MAG: arylamine N-acetyltransferase [Alphaproteobacteria bacterium]|nr:arylamine N-acetyltransferase [Alphaproteobacteria bacterium]
MHIDAYLERIAFAGPVRPDLATLTALHHAHLQAIPYENLDVQLGRPVTIERAPIFDKMVARRRGGWCYEMNGLFGWALAELGFRVTRSAGAVMREVSGDASIGNHLVLKVELEEGLYLADVGFGDGPIDPIRIESGRFSSRGFGFALSRESGGWWRLHNHKGGGAASFDFNLAPADEALLARKCDWLQSNEESVFVQNAVCQRYTADGLAILRGRVLRTLTPLGHTDRLIAGAGEYVSVLDEVFALPLPEAAALWPKICARHEALMAQRPVSS